MSIIDDLFEKIYGFRPKKEGQSYEMLAAAVGKLRLGNNDIAHNQFLRGIYSKSLYQIDVLAKTEGIMGEAKDYTERGGKVGRGDLQKLGGALNDLPINGGAFFSATDYTKPARQYAEASKDIHGKDISLFHLRPSVEKDEEGRVKTFVITMHIYLPDYNNARFEPVWTKEGAERLKNMIERGALSCGAHQVHLDTVYDKFGNIMVTVVELTGYGFGGSFGDSAKGSFLLPDGYIRIEEELIGIHGITYEVPFTEAVEELRVDAEGNPILLIRDEKGEIDQLITDKELRRVEFTPSGEVVLD